jgi:gamma-glutamyltranspeptidase/glutathione hydrolase
MGFGSGIVPSGTGFVIQNRGCYFSLDESHHNAFKGGKRTFHTLCASMVERSGKFAASIGTMGGDIQPQVHVQLFMNYLKGMNPQESLDKPRWAFPYSIYESPAKLQYEDRTQETELRKIGHKLNLEFTGFSSQLGHAQIVQANRYGCVEGGADPRGDGISISL